MSDYNLVKDADVTITETITGQNITGATVTWMLLRPTESLAGDLDALSASALALKDNGATGGVVLTVPATGTFTVAIDPADTEDLAPGGYVVLVRVTLAAGDVLPIRTYDMTLVV